MVWSESVLFAQRKLLRQIVKFYVGWLPADVGDDAYDGIGIEVAVELDKQTWAGFRLLKTVVGGQKVVYEAGKISRAERPGEVSCSSGGRMIFVECFDHIADESRDVDLNEAYVLGGKASEELGEEWDGIDTL
jgi:hypothetical protein